MAMTHRERVERALSFREGDRPPIALFGTANRITNPLYFELLKLLDLTGTGIKDRPGKTAEYTDHRIADLFGVDFRHVIARYPEKKEKNLRQEAVDAEFFDEWGCGYKLVDPYPTMVYHPLAEASRDAIDSYPFPNPAAPERILGLAEEARHWYEDTDYYVTAMSPISGLAMDFCFYLRGQEQFLCDMYLDETFAHHLLDKVSDVIAELYAFYIAPIAPYIGWVEFESDYGLQDSLLLPVEKYREFIKEPNEKVFRAVKRVAPDVKLFLHSCGAVRELIPEFIAGGIDILQSLQPRAAGMDSLSLKKEFGSELVFHGGLDLQGGMNGTREEAIDEALRRLDAFSPGGGYIFGPSNHLQPDTPAENLVAVYETAQRYTTGGRG